MFRPRGTRRERRYHTAPRTCGQRRSALASSADGVMDGNIDSQVPMAMGMHGQFDTCGFKSRAARRRLSCLTCAMHERCQSSGRLRSHLCSWFRILSSHRTAKAVGHRSWVQPRAASLFVRTQPHILLPVPAQSIVHHECSFHAGSRALHRKWHQSLPCCQHIHLPLLKRRV